MSAFYESVMSGLGSRRRRPIGLRMTPMVDIIFLLLTFFVLTAKFQEQEKTLPIFVSKTPASAAVEQKPLQIYLQSRDAQTHLRIAGRPQILIDDMGTEDALLVFAQQFEEVFRTGTVSSVEICCDDAVQWDLVVKVYDVIYAMGNENITFRYQE